MQLHDVGELKEALDVNDANQALAQGWHLVAVVPRGPLSLYVLGRKVNPEAPKGEYVDGEWVSADE